MLPCNDNYTTTFGTQDEMCRYYRAQSRASRWERRPVNELTVEPLNESSSLYGNPAAFAAGVSKEAVEDTAKNLGLAMRINGNCYPVRMTAYKSLLDRAKIGGTVLSKLSRQVLAEVLNACLALNSSDALIMERHIVCHQ